MDTMTPPKRSEGPAPFEAGVTLGQEKHEQEQQRAQLLVAQLDLYGKLNHDYSHERAALQYCSTAVNKVAALGGYEEPGVSVGNLSHLQARAYDSRLGLTAVTLAYRGGGRFPIQCMTLELSGARLHARPLR